MAASGSANGNPLPHPKERAAGKRRRKARRGRPGLRARLVRLTALGLLAGTAVFALYALLLIPFTPGKADILRRNAAKPSVILSADGKRLSTYDDAVRIRIELEDVSPKLIDALIATEDRRFYTHRGVDYARLLSALAHTLVGDSEGGSTLTMQLARNLYPERIGQRSTVTRKLMEIITALRIERVLEKEEILALYLNTVPFLFRIRGVEMAARAYFGHPAAELSLVESATLVGMLKATNAYNPVRNPERSQRRRNVVLRQMLAHGKIDSLAFERATKAPLKTRFRRPSAADNPAPHFTAAVRTAMDRWAEEHDRHLETDGLVIRTTLDVRLQQMANGAVARQTAALQAVADVEWSRRNNPLLSSSPHDYVPARTRRKPFAYFWQARPELADAFVRESPRFRDSLRAGVDAERAAASLRADPAFMETLRQEKTRVEAGFVAIDPRSGHVKAWVGSRDFFRVPYDHVSVARRQPGSTFKPFVYAAALLEGYRPGDLFVDEEIEVDLGRGKVWRPANVSGSSGELITMREALAQSKNTVTVQLATEVGARRIATVARDMGITESELRPVPSLALGTSEVSLLEMVSAYATIADEGRYRAPQLIERIEDAQGNVLDTFSSEPRQALPEETAHTLADMMRGVVDHGTGQRIRSVFGVRCDIAGKTGTTQENADGWFLLLHPHLVGGSWVGFDDRRVTFRSDYWGQGAHNALYVVGDTYRQALRKGLLDPRPTLAPIPEPFDTPGFWRRAGDWLRDTWMRFRITEGSSGRTYEPNRPRRRGIEVRIDEEDVDRLTSSLRDAVRELERAVDDSDGRFGRDLEKEAAKLLKEIRGQLEDATRRPRPSERQRQTQARRRTADLRHLMEEAEAHPSDIDWEAFERALPRQGSPRE